MRYGGNTACVEVRLSGRDRVIILDAGSGIRELGNHLLDVEKLRSVHAQIFLSHTHWDHIMGFPFFRPIYLPSTQIRVYGPVSYEQDTLEGIVGGQMSYRYFPVREAELAADIKYVELKEGRFDLGDGLLLRTKYLNHPILCLGYRFEFENRVLCTAYDTEPFRNLFCTDSADQSYDEAMAAEGEQVAAEQNALIEDFFSGADLLIHDAQYTEKEYEAMFRGWGHTPMEKAIAAAARAGVKRLALFHHDPMRTDGQLDALADEYCTANKGTEVFFAREGQEIEL
jgi:phosphoribosyl 1,2-cyclic phosphodiesterase